MREGGLAEEGSEGGRPDLLDYGWVGAGLLLLVLSLMPFVVPMADAVPAPSTPPEHPVQPRRHDRVVLMIVDGLGYRRAADPSLMPHLHARMRLSAAGKALASFPTVTPSGLRSILSGHRVASEPQLPTGIGGGTPEADSVMARAAKGGLKAFVVGQFSWEPLFPSGHGAKVTVIPYNGIDVRYDHGSAVDMSRYDEKVLDKAAPILAGERGSWDLVVLHLFEADSIGHAMGTANPFYQSHLRLLDRRIEELSRRVGEGRPTTFVLLADHGQDDDGSHGGLTSVEREVPFVVWGAGVRPGNLGTFPLYDAAPTLAALLGLPPPAQSEGWPRLEALQLTDEQRAAAFRDLLRQRLERWLTMRAAFPWVVAGAQKGAVEADRLWRLGRFAVAASVAERSARSLDASVDAALPRKWLWKVIASLWALVLAAAFGLAWSRAGIRTVGLTAALGAACLLILVLPLLRPSHMALASSLALAASLGVMGLALAHGLGTPSGLDRREWAFWWLALIGLAFQEVVDIALWSWLVLSGLFFLRSLHLSRQNAATTWLSLAAVAACAVLVSGARTSEASLVRFLLPDPRWPAMERLPWRSLSLAAVAAWALGSHVPLVRSSDAPRPWLVYALVTGPAVAAELLMRWRPSAAVLAWAACAASLAVLLVLRPPAAVRGMWLSALALAIHRTLADDRQCCLLVLAVVAGWALAWRSRDAHPLFEGLGLLGVGLWSYKLSGSQLSFSHIEVSEGYRVIGEGWHPYALMAVLTLKPIAAIGAPILPRLAIRPLHSVLGVFPLLGALSAGNMTMLWWGRFMTGNAQKLSDSAEFAQTEFVLLLAWLVLGLWAAASAVGGLSGRLARLRRA